MSPETGYSEDGVDLTLIRWMLSLTPSERLDVLDDFANFVMEARAIHAPTEIPGYSPARKADNLAAADRK